MIPALWRVASGLHTTSFGLRMVTWAVGLIVGSWVLMALALGIGDAAGGAIIPFLAFLDLLLLLLAAGGYVVGIVGRFRCLAVPPEATIARVRMRFAALFEACGLLSGTTAIVEGLFVKLLPAEAMGVTLLFALLMTVAGRVFYLLFLRALAEFIGDREQAAEARAAFRTVVFGLVGGVVGGFGLYVVCVGSSSEHRWWMVPIGMCSCLTALAAGIAALSACVMYVQLLRKLGDTVGWYAADLNAKADIDWAEGDSPESDEV